MENLAKRFFVPFDPTPVKPQDLSRRLEPTFKEVPPHFVDKSTGELLNDSDFVKLVPGKPVDVYAKIQSFKDDCDIYQILAKCQASGDYSLLHQREGSYGDISDYPDNLNDAHNSIIGSLSGKDPALVKLVAEGGDDAAIAKYVKDLYLKSHPEPVVVSGDDSSSVPVLSKPEVK